MLTVRFPDGTAVEFNQANFCFTTQNCFQLYADKEKKFWIANVPLGCVVEGSKPSRIFNPVRTPSGMLQQVLDHLREMPPHQLAALKRELREFDAAVRRWK